MPKPKDDWKDVRDAELDNVKYFSVYHQGMRYYNAETDETIEVTGEVPAPGLLTEMLERIERLEKTAGAWLKEVETIDTIFKAIRKKVYILDEKYDFLISLTENKQSDLSHLVKGLKESAKAQEEMTELITDLKQLLQKDNECKQESVEGIEN